jgi:hypothetical protein
VPRAPRAANHKLKHSFTFFPASLPAGRQGQLDLY